MLFTKNFNKTIQKHFEKKEKMEKALIKDLYSCLSSLNLRFQNLGKVEAFIKAERAAVDASINELQTHLTDIHLGNTPNIAKEQ